LEFQWAQNTNILKNHSRIMNITLNENN
jgi:hypothetical protein